MNWHKLYIPLVVVTLALALLMGFSWFRAHEALRDALAQEDVLKVKSEQLQAQIDASGKAEQQANAALEKEKHKPATIETVNKFIPLPGPIQLVQTPGELPKVEIGGDAQKNLDALQTFAIECQECKNSLVARDAQIADVRQQLALSEKNAAGWKKAAGRHTGFFANLKEWGIRSAFVAGGYAAGRLSK